MIITDEEALRVKCEDVLPEEVAPLREQLENELKRSAELGRPGIGLAAPQIGIAKNMAIVRAGNNASYSLHVDLVNCKIKDAFDKAIFEREGCLSYPGRVERTWRYQEIYVVDNLVEPYSFVGSGLFAVVCQHECLPNNSIIETKDGPKKIIDIVNNREKCDVLCLDEKNNFIYSKVIGWSKRRNTDKKRWIRLKLSETGPNKSLICTEDHKCATITDDILSLNHNVKVKYVEAQKLLGKYIVRKPIDRLRNSEVRLYNKEQISSIVGGLLGDLCIDSRGSVLVSHGEKQKEYANYKATILNGYTKAGYSGYRNEFSNTTVNAPITEQTKLLRKLAYIDGKKTIKNIIKYIDDVTLAFWYMDDGCFLKKREVAQFHTEGFCKSDVELLSQYLKLSFDIDSSIYKRKLKSGIKYILVLSKEGSKRLFNRINKYMHDSMQYKIPKKYRTDFVAINNERLPFSLKCIKKIKDMPKLESCLYDMEVENYHNFVANNTVVHNCDHLGGILLPDVAIKNEQIVKKKKIRPNDPCPCNSGKKFKRCCGK